MVLYADERSASSPSRFTPGKKRLPGTHFIGDWEGLRAGLDAVEKTHILPLKESNPSHPARSPVAIPNELSPTSMFISHPLPSHSYMHNKAIINA
jgi:hypothetical protein